MMANEPKRLYRSRKNRMIAGVCGGIAEYFNVDPVWIRLVTLLLAFANGAGILTGILIYILAWIIIPENPHQYLAKETAADKVGKDVSGKISKKREDRGMVIIGIIFLLLGLTFLLDRLSNIDINYVWPVLLISLGFFLLVRRD